MKQTIKSILIAIVGFFVLCSFQTGIIQTLVTIVDVKIAMFLLIAIIGPVSEELYKNYFRTNKIVLYGFVILEAFGYIVLQGAPIVARLVTAYIHYFTINVICSERFTLRIRLTVAIIVHITYNSIRYYCM